MAKIPNGISNYRNKLFHSQSRYKVFWNTMLRRIFGLKRAEGTRG
jgi:hypothetical protein